MKHGYKSEDKNIKRVKATTRLLRLKETISLILHIHSMILQPWIDRAIPGIAPLNWYLGHGTCVRYLSTPSSKSTKNTDDRAISSWELQPFLASKKMRKHIYYQSFDWLKSYSAPESNACQSHMTLRLCRSTGWSLSGTISTCSWCSRGKKT